MAGVVEQIIENPGYFVRITDRPQLPRQVQLAGHPPLGQDRSKLAAHLLQHPLQIGVSLLQFQMGKAEAGNIKEFIDEVLQPLSLLQSHTV